MTAEEFKAAVLAIGWDPADFEESFSHSGGPGGQHVNKVSTAVALVHGPTRLSVRVEDSRSQAKNRFLARARMIELILATRQKAAMARQQAREKKRRQNAKRPRGVKERILQTKHRRSEVKKNRRTQGGDD